jgi:23S rRNA (guanine2445-N2)-methyltransferase / 23S rRNA (guanine2069-N7)-methyltransferase
MPSYGFFATAPMYLGSLLADELTGLGIGCVTEARGGARFEGDLEAGYRACLWSRVANRILLPLAQLPAQSPAELYAGALDVPWEEHLDPRRTFAVRFDGQVPGIDNRQFGALKVKDAIADRFSRRLGRRPDVDPHSPDLWIHCHGHGGEATLALDLAGESLHRRGYREEATAAPLKENLAAAVLLRAGWAGLAAEGAALLDPMCGSGTMPIEGALIAHDIAPGLLRRGFGLAAWLGHESLVWERLLEEARGRREAGLARGLSIRGYDTDPTAIRMALANLARAGLAGRVHFERRELADCRPGREGERGLVVVNPPYGERLGADGDLAGLYALLGRVLRERFQTWRAAVFTGNPELGKTMGLRARRMHRMLNGTIECRLLHFEVEPQWTVVAGPRPLAPEARGPGAAMLANRLAKNLKALRKWRETEGVTCFRLYDADLPEYALAVDLYACEDEDGARCAVVQEYAAPASVDPAQARRRLREALGTIPEVLEIPPERLYLKVRRQQKGASQYERLADTGRFRQVAEGDCRFLVNFEDYLDTGLFLDHRETRRLIGRESAGRRFLNLFAYTGTATVYAARGGATGTVTVDMSRTYLDWAARNLALNGVRGPTHDLIQADCLDWLDWAAEAPGRNRFGLIFLDPPTFSTSKRMQGTLDIQRDHPHLIRAAAQLLEPDGTLIFSNNLRKFRMDLEALPGLSIVDIGRETLPRDFARNPRIHNCWRIRWLD